jgi:predicted naringenin-chalcone synthase
MQMLYAMDEQDRRKLRFLYRQCGIDHRYSFIPDYSRPLTDWKFYPQSENIEPFPSLEQRMSWFNRYAPQLSLEAIRRCLDHRMKPEEITHLISVSCTGMSAPGLDLQVMELLDLPRNIFRTSVNFMGCYAAIHALKLADHICRSDRHARVLVFCTELCTLHLQKDPTPDNLASGLLFSDGSAAALVIADEDPRPGLRLNRFYSEVVPKGKKDMSWELSSTGFQMTLSGYVPDLIEEDIARLVDTALEASGRNRDDVRHWCVHPGGKKILEAVQKKLDLPPQALQPSYEVLSGHGNMSSATILFVLKELQHRLLSGDTVFGLAFGPGLTMETFTATAE